MDPSSPLDRETIFRIELPLEEDVVAELERFVYLGRLGIVEEALQILDEILWRHLQHFPVAAEAVAFLIEHKMWTELHRTVNEIHYRNIRFTSNDENEFVDTLTTFVKHRAYQFIDLTEPCLTLADINGEHLDDQYTSPAKMQTLELLTIAAFNYPTNSTSPGDYHYISDVCVSTADHFHALLDYSLLWDATRIFSIYCAGTPRKDHVLELYRELVLCLGGTALFSTSVQVSLEDREKLICALVANEALMTFLDRMVSTGHQSFAMKTLQGSLLDRSIVLVDKLFHNLNDPPPRGRRVEFCRYMSARRGKTKDWLSGSSSSHLPIMERPSITARGSNDGMFNPSSAFEREDEVSHYLHDQNLQETTSSEPFLLEESDDSHMIDRSSRDARMPTSTSPERLKSGRAVKSVRTSLNRRSTSGEIQRIPNRQKRSHAISEEDWARVRLDVTRLIHLRSGLTCDEVIIMLARDHDLRPSRRQVVNRLQRWGLSKHLRRPRSRPQSMVSLADSLTWRSTG